MLINVAPLELNMSHLSKVSRPVPDVSGDHHMEPQRGKVYRHNRFPHGFDPCNLYIQAKDGHGTNSWLAHAHDI